MQSCKQHSPEVGWTERSSSPQPDWGTLGSGGLRDGPLWHLKLAGSLPCFHFFRVKLGKSYSQHKSQKYKFFSGESRLKYQCFCSLRELLRPWIPIFKKGSYYCRIGWVSVQWMVPQILQIVRNMENSSNVWESTGHLENYRGNIMEYHGYPWETMILCPI